MTTDDGQQNALLMLMREKLLELEKALILASEMDVKFKLKHDIQVLKQDIAERESKLGNSKAPVLEKFASTSIQTSKSMLGIWIIAAMIAGGGGVMLWSQMKISTTGQNTLVTTTEAPKAIEKTPVTEVTKPTTEDKSKLENNEWYNKGVKLEEEEKYDLAIVAYKQQIDINPKHTQVWYHLGEVLYQSSDKPEQLNEAIYAYKQQLDIVPNHPDAWGGLGHALLYLYRLSPSPDTLNAAVSAYRKQIVINPNHSFAGYGLGNALYNKGDKNGAIAAYEEQVKVTPQYKDAWYALGDVSSEEGDTEAAINAYEKVLEIDPNNEDAQKKLTALRKKK